MRSSNISAILPSLVVWLGCAGEGPGGEPRYESSTVCRYQSRWVCPAILDPGSQIPGDPMREACGIARSQAYIGAVSWAGFHGQNGAVRSVVEYDEAGRPTAIVSDCGLDTPVVDQFIWSEEGRFEALRWPNFELTDISDLDCRGDASCWETRAVYDDAGVLVGKEANGGPHVMEVDDQGRIVNDTFVDPLDQTDLRLEFDYAGTQIVEKRWVRETGTTSSTFIYDDDGRLLTIDTTFADGEPEGYQPPVFTWSGSTVVVENHEFRSVTEVDADGRPVRMEAYAPKDEQVSTIEWTWGANGRLEEVFFEEWGH